MAESGENHALLRLPVDNNILSNHSLNSRGLNKHSSSGKGESANRITRDCSKASRYEQSSELPESIQKTAKQQTDQAFQLTGALLDLFHHSQEEAISGFVASSSSHQLCQQLDAIKVAVVLTDIYDNVLHFNDSFVSLWKLPPAVLAARKYSQYIAYIRQRLEDSTCLGKENSPVYLKGGAQINQHSRKHFSGDKLTGQTWVHCNVKLLTAGEQRKERLAERELTNRAQQNLSADYREKKLADWFERECDRVKDFDSAIFALYNQQVFAVNAVAEALTGYSQTEMHTLAQFKQMAVRFGSVGSSAAFAHSESDSSASRVESERALSARDREVCLVAKDGKECWLRCSIQRRTIEGHCLCLLIAVEITDIKQRASEAEDIVAIEQYLSWQRSQLVEEIAHKSLGDLNLISMSADLLDAYGDSWTASKKKAYTMGIRESAARILTQLQDIRKVDRLSLNQLAVSSHSGALSQPTSNVTASEVWPISRLSVADCVDVHRLCYQLVEAFKHRYQQHAFVTFCVANEPKAYINQTLLQAIVSCVIEVLSLSTTASLVKVIVDSQPDRLTLRIHNVNVGIGLPNQEKTPIQAGSVDSNLVFVKSLLDIAQGEIFMEQQQEQTIVTIKLPLIHLNCR